MILTSKEKWLVNRLKKSGYDDRFHNYSEEECALWKPIGCCHSFDWTNTFIFYIKRYNNLRIEFRPGKMESLHLIKYFPSLGIKNWHEIAEYENFVKEKFLY